jgi:DNA polymerase III epsilon subunit-like protein
MYLFFDTETTGLPLNWNAPIENISNWPRMVQIAWMLYDDGGMMLDCKDYIIKPEDYTIPKEASSIHGITTETATMFGNDLKKVLNNFQDLIKDVNFLVAHNISFDEKIVGAEFLRKNMDNNLEKKNKICTMKQTADFCAIKGKYGNKWPKLSELHNKLFESDFEDAHNAAVDIRITAKCFWELKRREVL